MSCATQGSKDDAAHAASSPSLRESLASAGVTGELTLIADVSVVGRGGVNPGREAVRALVDLDLAVDAERLIEVPGLRFDFGLQIQQGRDGSIDTGDAQVYSNIDTPDRVQLSRALLEQHFVDNKVWLKLGKFDANDDFALVDAGALHVHSSFGFAPTIAGFPSYPDPAFGLAAFVESDTSSYARAGIFDGATQSGFATGKRGPSTLFGAPSALFFVGEVGLRLDRSDDDDGGKVALGAWRHTGTFTRADGRSVRGLDGLYANWEQQLYQVDPSDRRRGFRAFGQYGYANPAGSSLQNYFGLGATWTGLGPARPEDVAGIGLAWVRFRDRRTDGVRGGGEFAIETFLRVKVHDRLVLMPDLQWIHDPSGDVDIEDALVLTLRFESTL